MLPNDPSAKPDQPDNNTQPDNPPQSSSQQSTPNQSSPTSSLEPFPPAAPSDNLQYNFQQPSQYASAHSGPTKKAHKKLLVAGVLVGLVLVLLTALYAVGAVASRAKITEDAVKKEALILSKKELNEKVSNDKTIPDAVQTANGVTYTRVDNQTAKLCATFALSSSGEGSWGLNPINVFNGYFNVRASEHQIYRDNVDFARHDAGMNCYVINYAPINVGYEAGQGGLCDLKRKGDHGIYRGQTIKGFTIGGPLTAGPASDKETHLVLAQDVDAFDSSCKKIPVSALNVGDKVELDVNKGLVNGNERTYFVIAIKKTQ